jgi:hypothetical protein
MKASSQSCLKGAALLAAAGVTLADAQWLFASQRSSYVSQDPVRLVEIRRKVNNFLATATVPALAHRHA